MSDKEDRAKKQDVTAAADTILDSLNKRLMEVESERVSLYEAIKIINGIRALALATQEGA